VKLSKRSTKISINALAFSVALLTVPCAVFAQERTNQMPPTELGVNLSRSQQPNVPAEARQAEDAVERAVRRFRIGVEGGVGLDPEIIMFGAHGAFGPIFNRNVEFRPGIEFGIGELTTLFGINLDVLYVLPGAAGGARWTPYVGAGPNFTLSHRGFESDDDDEDDGNRFDFSDTDFVGGFNFFAGARTQNGLFLEMKSTAYGVSNIRFLVGFNF
jgi:hypothetical protein